MCKDRNQLRFRVEEVEQVGNIAAWVLLRVEQGYDLHWDLQGEYRIWVCVPGNLPALEEFLGSWGNLVTADSRT